MLSPSGAGSPDGAVDSAVSERRTCLSCRKSKVKCDMAMPCSRCTKLSVECVPTPPSQRGRPGERQTKRRRRLQAIGVQTEDMPGVSLNMKYHAIVMNTCADGLETAKDGE
jgi:hypothetical protein